VSEAILSAGAVLWRPDAHGIELLLVHRPKYDDWSLPKGKREPGEHVLLTAAREVHEETSVRPVFGPRLRTAEYLAHGRPTRPPPVTRSTRCPGCRCRRRWGGSLTLMTPT
jgi:8-oxo-(d)GTP phosphatase